MRARVALAALGALAIFVTAASSAMAKTFRLEGLGLSITLPAGWLQQSADPGWRFKAAVPDDRHVSLSQLVRGDRAQGEPSSPISLHSSEGRRWPRIGMRR